MANAHYSPVKHDPDSPYPSTRWTVADQQQAFLEQGFAFHATEGPLSYVIGPELIRCA
jgi:hypothetical protein